MQCFGSLSSEIQGHMPRELMVIPMSFDGYLLQNAFNVDLIECCNKLLHVTFVSVG